jgi:hypothetical protein
VFNLDYKCTIDLILKKVPDVPVFLIVFCSFVLGMLSTLPFIFSYQQQKKRKAEEKKDGAADSSNIPNSNHYGID